MVCVSWCSSLGDSVPIFWAYPGLTSGLLYAVPFGTGIGWGVLRRSLPSRFASTPSHYDNFAMNFISARNPQADAKSESSTRLWWELLFVVVLRAGVGSFVGQKTPSSG
jgi:hypothetical protein